MTDFSRRFRASQSAPSVLASCMWFGAAAPVEYAAGVERAMRRSSPAWVTALAVAVVALVAVACR